MNEKEIIRCCKNGDKAAFDTLIRTFYPYATKYLLKITRDENVTEDLTQEVFLKVIRTTEGYRTDGKASFAYQNKKLYLISLLGNKDDSIGVLVYLIYKHINGVCGYCGAVQYADTNGIDY